MLVNPAKLGDERKQYFRRWNGRDSRISWWRNKGSNRFSKKMACWSKIVQGKERILRSRAQSTWKVDKKVVAWNDWLKKYIALKFYFIKIIVFEYFWKQYKLVSMKEIKFFLVFNEQISFLGRIDFKYFLINSLSSFILSESIFF